MELKLIQNKDNKLIFIIKNTTPGFINTLRRVMLSEVQTLAVKKVIFTKNSSALFDEIIAHRLGMVSLTSNSDYTMQAKCSCKGEGCTKCQSSITLKAEGPLTVYASDLKFQDTNIKPVYPKTPIIKLLKGQELEFEALIGMGTGKEHAKFSPCLAFYRGLPQFTVNKKTKVKECIALCNGVLKEKGETVDVADLTKWQESYEEICENHEIIIQNSDKDFLFTIESWGKMPPEKILEKTLDVIDEKLDEFSGLLEKAKS